MNKTLYIVVGCDADPDRAAFVSGASDRNLLWTGITAGIPRAKDAFRNLSDSGGRPPIITWCVRVDEQISQLCGKYEFCLEAFKPLWSELESDGDEIAWHPHFWRFNEQEAIWFQDFLDRSWQINMLTQANLAYQSIFPGRGRSVRMGWTYHNSETMATLSKLGVSVDFSALPGLQIRPRQVKKAGANYFDWSTTPNHPYHPTVEDYRAPSESQSESLAILELPCFVSRSVLWGTGGDLFLSLKMRDLRIAWNALRRPTYLINITGKPAYFQPLIGQLRTELKKNKSLIFATYFHADELVAVNHPLYSLANFAQNLSDIRKAADEAGFELRYIQAKESAVIYRSLPHSRTVEHS